MKDQIWVFRCILLANTKGQGAVIMTNSEYGDHLYDEVLPRIAQAYNWPDWSILPMFKPQISSQEIEAIEKYTFFDPKNWDKYVGSYQFNKHIVELFFDQENAYLKVDQASPFVVIPISDTFGTFQRIDPGPRQLIRFKQEEGSEGSGLILTIFKADHKKVTKSRL
jgi:hypothetical protein